MGGNPKTLSSNGSAQQTFAARKDSVDMLDALPSGGAGAAVAWATWGTTEKVARPKTGGDVGHEADLRRVGSLLCALSVIGMLAILGWIASVLI